jgi:hypothetical protein
MTGGGRGFCNPYGTRVLWWPYETHCWTPYHWKGYGCLLGVIPTREQEINYLKDETQAVRETLEEIDARVKELAEEEK